MQNFLRGYNFFMSSPSPSCTAAISIQSLGINKAHMHSLVAGHACHHCKGHWSLYPATLPHQPSVTRSLTYTHTHTRIRRTEHTRKEAGMEITSSFVSLSDCVSLSPEEVSVWRMCHGWEDEFAWWTWNLFIYFPSGSTPPPPSSPSLNLISIKCRAAKDSFVSYRRQCLR